MDEIDVKTEEKIVVSDREVKAEDVNPTFSVDEKAQLYYHQFDKEIKRENSMFLIFLFSLIIFIGILTRFIVAKFDIAKYDKSEFLFILGVVWIGFLSATIASVPLIFVQSKFLSELKKENLSEKELRACFKTGDAGNAKMHWTDSMDWKKDALYDLVCLVILTAVMLGIWFFV